MNLVLKYLTVIIFILISILGKTQSSEIIELDQKNSYQYRNYYKDGNLKSIVEFYAKKPYSSIESFESNLKKYKIKYHGERKEFYENGQLKEIVVYKKGKVVEFMKQYFEDGEEFSVGSEQKPEFQFNLQQQNTWFSNKIKEIETKYKINLEGSGIIVLFISKDGTIKSIKVKIADENLKKYLIEIGEQIKVTKPASKNGQNIGTKFAFKIEL